MIITMLAMVFGSGVIFGSYFSTHVPEDYREKISQERYERIIEYVDGQTDLYGDLCAEARGCQFYYDPNDPDKENESCTDEEADKRGSASLLIEAHYEGVKCSSESIRWMIEAELEPE